MVAKVICCALWSMGLLCKFAGIFLLIAGYNETQRLTSETTTPLGLSLLLVGVILFLIGVVLLIHKIRRERIDHLRSYHGSSVEGPASGKGLPAESSPSTIAGAANPPSTASQGDGTQHVELHEMTDVVAPSGDTLRPDAPPARAPPSQPGPALQEAVDLRGRSPLGLYPPLRYSSSESRGSKGHGDDYQGSNMTSELATAIEPAVPKSPEPVIVRHVRFAEPLVPSKINASLTSSNGISESVSLSSPHHDASVANKLSFHSYKVENGNITDLETGQLVDADQLHNPQDAFGISELGSMDKKRAFGVARTAQHTFKVGDGMFLDFSSLESAILRGGGSLKAGLDSEVSKSKGALKAWKSSSSMRALLKNTSRGGKVSDMEFV